MKYIVINLVSLWVAYLLGMSLYYNMPTPLIVVAYVILASCVPMMAYNELKETSVYMAKRRWKLLTAMFAYNVFTVMVVAVVGGIGWMLVWLAVLAFAYTRRMMQA